MTFLVLDCLKRMMKGLLKAINNHRLSTVNSTTTLSKNRKNNEVLKGFKLKHPQCSRV